MKRSMPPKNFDTGFDVEEHSFTWTIRNFPLVRDLWSIVDSQMIDFTAGESIGHHQKCTWTVFLKEEMVDRKRWIGIFCRIKNPSKMQPYLSNLFAEMTYTTQNKKGKTSATTRKHFYTEGEGESENFDNCWGKEKFIDADNRNTCTDDDLVIDLKFKLYVQSESKPTNPLQAIMEEFQPKFAAQAQKDLIGLRKNPIPFTDIKIVSNDKKEFSMPRGILAVRSDVFAAMIRHDMAEANSGVIQLPDISSKALEVLLDFLYTGELNSEWSHPEVIVELTYAAGKYQLKDLLQFLDMTMGKVCQLENVGALVTLARQLSLKFAEEELIRFVRRKGVDSADNFIQMWNTELPVIEPGLKANANRPRKAMKRKRSRRCNFCNLRSW